MIITYRTIKPDVLMSSINCEKILRWLDKKGYSTIVIEHPDLLSEGEKGELEKILGKNIYTTKIKEVNND